MKLRIGHVYQAAELVTAIINQARALPEKGAYRFSRLYGKLKPEYEMIVARRNAMITAYRHEALQINGNVIEDTEENRQNPNASVAPAVPDDKMPEFSKAWADVCAEEIEVVGIEPIPLSQLSFGSDKPSIITAAEYIILNDLVKED